MGGGGRVVRWVLGEDGELRGRFSATAVLIVPGVEQVRRERERERERLGEEEIQGVQRVVDRKDLFPWGKVQKLKFDSEKCTTENKKV